MDKPIRNIKLQFNCSARWDGMEEVNGGRFCNHCSKVVYDFTDTKQQEFLEILAENSGFVCGRYAREQMVPGYLAGLKWKKWLSAAAVLAGVSVFNEKARAQAAPPDINKQELSVDALAVGRLTASDVSPQFPGGQVALESFLSKNIHWKKGMKNGRVFASFWIEKDGAATDFKIVRGVSALNDAEVLRVLRHMPRWKPAVNNGKAVKTAYTVPVTFTDEK